MPFALLQVAEIQLGELMLTKPAGQELCQQRPITFAFQSLAVGRLPKCLRLFGGQPVAEPDSLGFSTISNTPLPMPHTATGTSRTTPWRSSRRTNGSG